MTVGAVETLDGIDEDEGCDDIAEDKDEAVDSGIDDVVCNAVT